MIRRARPRTRPTSQPARLALHEFRPPAHKTLLGAHKTLPATPKETQFKPGLPPRLPHARRTPHLHMPRPLTMRRSRLAIRPRARVMKPTGRECLPVRQPNLLWPPHNTRKPRRLQRGLLERKLVWPKRPQRKPLMQAAELATRQ